MGLKIDDKGGITYHGPTSLFHLPSDRDNMQTDYLPAVDTDAHRRERLVSNAWHQRALENLSDIPVSLSGRQLETMLRVFVRNRFNIS